MFLQTRQILLLVVAVVFFVAVSGDHYHPRAPYHNPGQTTKATYEDPSSWPIKAQEALAKKLKERNIVKKAKNLIFFLGDGYGVTTITATRIQKGQSVDKSPLGEEAVLYPDTFPHTGAYKTYCVDSQTADSACSTTAYLCGTKTNIGTIGVNSNVQYGDCDAQKVPQNQVTSILKWAQDAGKATGIVTTTRVTHATPAGAYAHIADRDWECDADFELYGGNDRKTCGQDIAAQLILSDPGINFDVILGGGRSKFLPVDVIDIQGNPGQRLDGQNLIQAWLTIQQNSNGHQISTSHSRKLNATYVETVEELLSVDALKTDRLLGLFDSDHMAYYFDQAPNHEPTLTDMTEKAIEILSKNPRGFVLLVEGGRIDHAHHDNKGLKTLWEAIEFNRAIEKGDQMTSGIGEDTLIVVSADHSHSFSFAGYAERGTPMTGFAGIGDDDIPYSTMGYANGPGWLPFLNEQRHNISNDDVTNIEYQQVPLVPLSQDTHGGEDVLLFAKGPFSHLFTGVQEQNYIPFAMAYAACIGPGRTYCDHSPSPSHGWSQ